VMICAQSFGQGCAKPARCARNQCNFFRHGALMLIFITFVKRR
jgi:hypothetical protein